MDPTVAPVVVETGPNPTACVVWLHGLGADGHDFEPVVPELGLTFPVRFIFPHARKRPVTLNRGLMMRAWYDIAELDLGRDVDKQGLDRSAAELKGYMASLPFPANRVVLAGFSQGGAVTLHLGLRYPERLAGLVVLSAYAPVPETLSLGSEPNKKTPILQCHGRFDSIVPRAAGEQAANTLKQLGYDVDWRTYPMDHSVSAEELRHIAEFLTRVLA